MKSWLNNEHDRSQLDVKRIPFIESREWHWKSRDSFKHHTERFFSIVGVRYYSVEHHSYQHQPIIDQPEIGLLSFLVCKDQGDWWILAHAKVEPGNVHGAQLAPTIQATKSNYEMVHGGSSTPYLDLQQAGTQVLYDQLQSEHNSRFLCKRNRNNVVRIETKAPLLGSQFKWIPIETFLSQLKDNYVINTDARSVLACWLFTDISAMSQCLPSSNLFSQLLIDSIQSEQCLHTTPTIQSWLESLNSQWQSQTETVPLNQLGPDWICNDSEIRSPRNPSLICYHIDVTCKGREVSRWDQPIFGTDSESEIVLLIGSFKGTLHLLVQAKLEAGNRNGFELTTTIQAEPHILSADEKQYLKIAETGKILSDVYNSEEGGRFDQCISRYRIVWIDQVDKTTENAFHRWISLSQFSDCLKQSNMVTNELRSAASSLLCVENR